MPQILKSDDEDAVLKALNVLKKGGVIVYPTETLYGLGALALREDAVEKIYRLKQRQYKKPLLILVRDLEMLRKFFNISPKYLNLYKKFLNKPLTIVLNQKLSFPDSVSAGTKKIGVRISSNDFVRRLFRLLDEPITSTSANISGDENVYSFEEVLKQFGDNVELIVDSGNLPPSKGSTVIDLTTSPPDVIREGDLTIEELKDFFNGKS